MKNESHILISLTPQHAENIFSGHKLVELRRRNMHIAPGTIAWIYVKLPVGAIIGKVTVSSMHVLAPSGLWKKFGVVSGLSKKEFFEYFNGAKKGIALELENINELRQPIPLTSLRGISPGFQPPQFFIRLKTSTSLLKKLLSTKLR